MSRLLTLNKQMLTGYEQRLLAVVNNITFFDSLLRFFNCCCCTLSKESRKKTVAGKFLRRIFEFKPVCMYLFKFRKKNTRIMFMTSFWCLYCWPRTDFTYCSGVSTDNCEKQMPARMNMHGRRLEINTADFLYRYGHCL